MEEMADECEFFCGFDNSQLIKDQELFEIVKKVDPVKFNIIWENMKGNKHFCCSFFIITIFCFKDEDIDSSNVNFLTNDDLIKFFPKLGPRSLFKNLIKGIMSKKKKVEEKETDFVIPTTPRTNFRNSCVSKMNTTCLFACLSFVI